MGYDDARHLLARTGFGPTDAEVAQLRRPRPASRRVTRLLARHAHDAGHARRPRIAHRRRRRCAHRRESATPEERRAFLQQQIARRASSCAPGGCSEMLATPSPLTERMTLFWHNHFVSSQQKVRFAQLMYRQNVHVARARARQLRRAAARGRDAIRRCSSTSTTRRTARGAAERELRARGDGALHARRRPLHRARHQGSRARVHRLEPRPRHRRVRVPPRAARRRREDRARPHRPLRRRRGARHPARAAARPREFIVAQAVARVRLARARCRARSSASPQRFRALAATTIKAALRALLTSRRVLGAASNRGALVKSPVELVVGTLRTARRRARRCDCRSRSPRRGIGQNLFSPPNVKGWPGGEAWINTQHAARAQAVPRAPRARRRAARDAAMTRSAAAPMRRDARSPRPTTRRERGARFAPRDRPRHARACVRRRAWVASLPGDTPDGKHASAQRCCCRSRRRSPDVARATPTRVAFVRATLLDPAYQLK